MLSLPRARAQSLVGELRSHKLRGTAKKKKKFISHSCKFHLVQDRWREVGGKSMQSPASWLLPSYGSAIPRSPSFHWHLCTQPAGGRGVGVGRRCHVARVYGPSLEMAARGCHCTSLARTQSHGPTCSFRGGWKNVVLLYSR